MEILFNDALWYIFLILFGIPTFKFSISPDFEFKKDKKKVIVTYLIAYALLLLLLSTFYGIDETTKKLEKLFGYFIRFTIYMSLGFFILFLLYAILKFLVAHNKKQFIINVVERINDFWKINDDCENK